MEVYLKTIIYLLVLTSFICVINGVDPNVIAWILFAGLIFGLIDKVDDWT